MGVSSDVLVEKMTSTADLARAFEVNCAAFGEQTNDGIWSAIFPSWNSTIGKQQAISRLAARLESDSKNKDGEPNTVFIKATVPSRDDPSDVRIVAGFAIWMQGSAVPGFGEKPLENEISNEELELLYPGDAKEQRYLRQLLVSLHQRRTQVIMEKADASPPAVFILDSCAVDPAFQRRGIATQLVRWGLDEAKRRGGLECITEASSMGRHVYLREGFEAEGPDMTYDVDEEFTTRDRPPNVFLRTRKDLKWTV
ncbi:MAG: hypothetical protein GOMPHAMPRED_002593 [Gomphillus americanus]|uniref:N-acetyltransferase domain-containing protein n=1 Tax=Gomphillus americanus TaxID=1940652 RepID=A0A8H3FKB9_9LECA|nr:MAG: hypothetical protein GOMPHAMPRED_002593 [Gomphillus americanus]